MSTFVFLGVVLGILNSILIAVVIFILKQPDPNKGRELSEMQEIHERLNELSKHLITFDKKIEKALIESKNENIAKLDRVTKDMGRQLKDIHDNL